MNWQERNFHKKGDGTWAVHDRHLKLSEKRTLTSRQLKSFPPIDRRMAIKIERVLAPMRRRLESLRTISKIAKAYEAREPLEVIESLDPEDAGPNS